MTLPTPVFIAGAVACLLAGFLAGAVVTQNGDSQVATVVSYTPGEAELCLRGKAMDKLEGAEDGELCGTWRRTPGSRVPAKGEQFRFVAVQTQGRSGGEDRSTTVFYGDVAP